VTRRLGILGSTGSIGTQTLDVVRQFPDEFDVAALSTHTNVEVLRKQVDEFEPDAYAISDPETASEQSWGETDETLRSLARNNLDILMVSVVGMAGLLPTLDALDASTDVALASKEAMVVGGELIREAEQRTEGRILPVDSEHHAVFQLLRGEDIESVRRIYLTASGGPFLDRDREDLAGVTPSEALDHPNWDMGPKITIDSATMMNKGLELIEAKYLFDLDPDQVQAVIHPQSKVHALVEFKDRSVKAHMSEPDMRQSIQSALFHPDRRSGFIDALDFTETVSLRFDPINRDRFPAYKLARRALREGGTATTVLNAANDEAVRAFLETEIDFLEIPEIVNECLEAAEFDDEMTIDRTLEADRWARDRAKTIMGSRT
jgi:1-deoxy-D-xylulose-5-phosphate reductoisomerase